MHSNRTSSEMETPYFSQLTWATLSVHSRLPVCSITLALCNEENMDSTVGTATSLQTKRPRGLILSPGRGKIFLLSTSFRQVVRLIQSAFLGSKGTGTWSWPLTFNLCRGQEYVDLYNYSPIRLHGIVINKPHQGTNSSYNAMTTFWGMEV
jgi:hypothetical protein